VSELRRTRLGGLKCRKCRFRHSLKRRFPLHKVPYFRRKRGRSEPKIVVQAPMVSKVYPTDQHIREFLGQWIHSLAAAA